MNLRWSKLYSAPITPWAPYTLVTNWCFYTPQNSFTLKVMEPILSTRQIKAYMHSWGIWGGGEHLFLVNVNNGWLMEASLFGIINLSCQCSIWASFSELERAHMLTFNLECFRCGSANDVKVVGRHLETLSCHLQKCDALNRSWHLMKKVLLLTPVCVSTLLRRFNKSSASSIYTCKAVQDILGFVLIW